MRASISFSHLSRPAAVLMLLLFLATVTYAQITPSADAYINTAAPTTNYGTAVTLGVVSPSQTTYIAFDLSSIPAGYTGSNVAKASLKLYVNTVTTAGSFNVDYVNGSWSEKTINANNAPPPGATIAASVPLAKAQALDYVIIDVSTAVEAWLNGTESNYGIALVANSPLSATLDSKENKTQSHPAELDVVFSGSGGGTITGVLTGAGSGLTGGGTSGTLNLSLLTSCGSGQVLSWNGSGWACTSLSGGGTITGVIAGTDLTGGGYSGTVTLNLDTTKVPQLNANNIFTGNQTVNGNLSATGLVTGTAFNIGSNLFAWGSYTNWNAFLGFAGNSTATGQYNTASGVGALAANTTGSSNTAAGSGALLANTTGGSNTAIGSWVLGNNTTGNYNTAIGLDALNKNTSGASNTATGVNALWYNTTGNGNTADGSNALSANTTGYNNTASGSAALFSNTTGQSNTADGNGALNLNTTGSVNTASGSSALTSNTTGSWNTAGGGNALNNNTTGGGNTAYGVNALYYNTTGNGNTALGYLAGPDQNSTNLSNSSVIGANAVVSASNALVLGCVNGVNNCPATVNVGIGTAKPAYMLDVQGTGNFAGLVNFASGQKFPGTGTITGITTAAGSGLTGGGTKGTLNLSLVTSCTGGQVLAWTGSAWACSSLSGGGTVTSVALTAPSTDFVVTGSPVTTSGTLGLGWLVAPDPNNTANAIVKRDGSGNFSAGAINAVSAFNLGGNPFAFGTYSVENAFLGFAGNATMTGAWNTASGYKALYFNTTGAWNTASGANALYSNKTGNYNTASGYEVLLNNTGSYNTASGAAALYSNNAGTGNTASGFGALSNNTTGNYNTADGYEALYSNNAWGTGSVNTASGYQALYSNTTGVDNTASGGQALQLNTTGVDNTASGNGALMSNGTGNENTAVGVLALWGNFTGSDLTCIGYNCNIYVDGITNATAIGANAQVGESNALVLGSINGVNGATSNTNVGIGTTTPDNLLTVNGSADKPGGGSWGTYSDRRLKTLDGSYNSGLSQILKLHPVRYRYNKENALGIQDTQEHVGLVAQDVKAVIPEAVTENNKGYLLVNNDPILWAMLNAIQEQQALIHKQQQQIVRLTRQVKTIQASLKANGRSGPEVRTVKAEETTVRQ